jgi:hypothetical protein
MRIISIRRGSANLAENSLERIAKLKPLHNDWDSFKKKGGGAKLRYIFPIFLTAAQ